MRPRRRPGNPGPRRKARRNDLHAGIQRTAGFFHSPKAGAKRGTSAPPPWRGGRTSVVISPSAHAARSVATYKSSQKNKRMRWKPKTPPGAGSPRPGTVDGREAGTVAGAGEIVFPSNGCIFFYTHTGAARVFRAGGRRRGLPRVTSDGGGALAPLGMGATGVVTNGTDAFHAGERFPPAFFFSREAG